MDEYQFGSLIYAKDAEETQRYLAQGVDANEHTYTRINGLMIASSLEQFKLLLEAGADINMLDYNDLSVADHQALTKEIYDFLKSNFADTFDFTKDRSYYTDVYKQEFDEIEKCEGNVSRFLMECDDPRIFKLLISKGANVNHTDENGETPLMLCFEEIITQMLLDNGANPYQKDNKGKTALNHVWNPKCKEILLRYVKTHEHPTKSLNIHKETIIHFMNDNKDIEINYLEEAKNYTDLKEIVDKDGWNLLVFSALTAKSDIVDFCIENKFDVNVKYNNRTLLYCVNLLSRYKESSMSTFVSFFSLVAVNPILALLIPLEQNDPKKFERIKAKYRDIFDALEKHGAKYTKKEKYIPFF